MPLIVFQTLMRDLWHEHLSLSNCLYRLRCAHQVYPTISGGIWQIYASCSPVRHCTTRPTCAHTQIWRADDLRSQCEPGESQADRFRLKRITSEKGSQRCAATSEMWVWKIPQSWIKNVRAFIKVIQVTHWPEPALSKISLQESKLLTKNSIVTCLSQLLAGS